MSEEKKKKRRIPWWRRVILPVTFVAGGVASFALGQPIVGAALISAAIGQQVEVLSNGSDK